MGGRGATHLPTRQFLGGLGISDEFFALPASMHCHTVPDTGRQIFGCLLPSRQQNHLGEVRNHQTISNGCMDAGGASGGDVEEVSHLMGSKIRNSLWEILAELVNQELPPT